MGQVCAFQLDFKIEKTNVRAQTINNTILKTYEIIVFNFSVLDKNDKEKFFEKSFLLANIN